MADENQIPDLKTQFTIELKSMGVADATSELEKLTQAEKKVGNSLEQIVSKFGSVKNAVAQLTKIYKAKSDVADHALDSEDKKVKKLTKTYGSLSSAVAEVKSGLKGLVLPASFGAALSAADNYNKTMLSLSSNVSRLGIGLVSLESNLTQVGKAASLTRSETNNLFDAFQAGMRVVSTGDFENIMKRMHSIVGANVEAMGKMQGSLVEVSQQYPVLSQSLAKLADQQNKMSQDEKNSIKDKIRLLYFIGKISDAQYRQLTQYTNGNEQISSSDKKRKKDMEAQVAAMNEFRRQIESISLMVGQSLLPFMTKIADLISVWKNGTRSFKKDLMAAAAVYTTFKIGKGLLGLGVGGMAKKGGIGGLVGSALGRKATNVYVTGIAPGVMRGGLGGTGKKLRTIKTEGSTVTNTAGRRMRGMAYKGMAAGGLLVGSQLLGGLSSSLGGNNTRGGAAAGLGSSAMSIGSMAMMGSMFGPIGTVVGALAGLALEIDNVTEGFSGLFGGSSGKIKQDFDQFVSDDMSKINKERADEVVYQKVLEKQNKINMKPIKEQEGEGYTFQQLKQAVSEGEEKQKKIYEDKGSSGVSMQDQAVSIQKKKDSLENLKGVFASKKGGMSEEQIAAYRKEIDLQEQSIRANEFNLEERKRITLEYGKTGKLIRFAQDQINAMTRSSQQQKIVVEELNALYSAQSGLMDANLSKMAKTGKVDKGAAFSTIKDTLKVLDARKEASKEYLNLLKSQSSVKVADIKDPDQYGANYAKLIKEAKEKNIVNIKSETAMAAIKKDIQAITVEELDALGKIGGIYSEHVKQADLLVSKAGIMVQLADNYAIGVGASAQMRMDEYNAIERSIGVLKQKHQAQLEAANMAESRNDMEQANSIRNAALETEIQITQQQQKQAQSVKALRDGWVSAMSSMNTASGGFSDIIMTKGKGLAQMQRLSGSIRSELTGAIGRGVGFDIAERFSAHGARDKATVTGGGRIGGSGKYQEAWRGKAHGEFSLRDVEMMQRTGVTDQITNAMSKRAASIVSGSPTALGGHSYAREAYVANASRGGGGGSSGGGSSGGGNYTPYASPVGSQSSISINLDLDATSNIKLQGADDLKQWLENNNEIIMNKVYQSIDKITANQH